MAGKKNLIISITLCILMSGSYFGAQALTPKIYLADTLAPLDLEKAIPTAFNGWKVEPQAHAEIIDPVRAQVIKEIYSQTLSRTYVDPAGRRVMLSIAYGKSQSDQRSLHYPDVCYPAQGFNIVEKRVEQFHYEGAEWTVKRLNTKMGNRVEPLTYWVTIGNKPTLTTGQAKWVQLGYGFNGYIPDGIIYRVSTIGGTEGWQVQDDFSKALLKALPNDIRERLAGAQAVASK